MVDDVDGVSRLLANRPRELGVLFAAARLQFAQVARTAGIGEVPREHVLQKRCDGRVGAFVRSASNVLLSSGNALFSMVSWIVIAAVGARNASGALAVAAWGNGVGAFGTIVGAEIGVASNWLVAGDSPALFAISGVLLVLFVAYVLIGLKRFSFKETIEGVTPPLVGAAVEHAETEPERFARRCDEIAERFGFTPREREVFEMLARGRNREYIQEKLVVSKNTVKVHVRHIYEKSGVHSHQQLIDLVEGDEATAPAR